MKKKSASSSVLADLPNVGPVVARLLGAAGIRTPGELRRIGAVDAALRIRAIRPADPPCRRMLAGLAGAIRGMRGHALPPTERERLWQAYVARLPRSCR